MPKRTVSPCNKVLAEITAGVEIPADASFQPTDVALGNAELEKFFFDSNLVFSLHTGADHIYLDIGMQGAGWYMGFGTYHAELTAEIIPQFTELVKQLMVNEVNRTH